MFLCTPIGGLAPQFGDLCSTGCPSKDVWCWSDVTPDGSISHSEQGLLSMGHCRQQEEGTNMAKPTGREVSSDSMLILKELVPCNPAGQAEEQD